MSNILFREEIHKKRIQTSQHRDKFFVYVESLEHI